LEAEKSLNIGGGLTLTPLRGLTLTADYYNIKIDDRIILSENLQGTGVVAVLRAAGIQDITSARFFINGIDTRTWGIDFSAAYPVALDFGSLNLSVSANYNKTKITKNKIPTVFSNISESYVEDASPDYKVVLGALFKSGAFTVNLRETFYGKTSVLVQPGVSSASLIAAGLPTIYEAKVKPTGITDLEVSYAFNDAMTFSLGANNLFDKVPETPALLT
ncbi:hypothetical protein LTR94_030542, partial [Friedmanniomyces endolithicus]